MERDFQSHLTDESEIGATIELVRKLQLRKCIHRLSNVIIRQGG